MMWIVNKSEVQYKFVEAYVRQLKQKIQEGNISITSRKKNTDFLRRLGWNYKALINFLYEHLCTEDYISGPEDDYDMSEGSVWKFGKTIFEDNQYFEVYIKIKDEKISIKCLSFHEAAHTLVYPLKEETT